MMEAKRTRVFVYGSLRHGQGNHSVIAGATRVGAARTTPEFTLYDLGPFPALVRGGATSVAGELYDVDGLLLERLDRLEGCPRLYQRQVIRLADGTLANSYMQRLDQIRGRAKIASGDWVDREKGPPCASG
jgi:gamma-glutamylaminecyclotransferase